MFNVCSLKVELGDFIDNYINKHVKLENGCVEGLRSWNFVESFNVDDVGSDRDEVKVEVEFGVDSCTEDGDAIVNTNKNMNIFEDEAPIHLLQP